jgi:hypothetical protein
LLITLSFHTLRRGWNLVVVEWKFSISRECAKAARGKPECVRVQFIAIGVEGHESLLDVALLASGVVVVGKLAEVRACLRTEGGRAVEAWKQFQISKEILRASFRFNQLCGCFAVNDVHPVASRVQRRLRTNIAGSGFTKLLPVGVGLSLASR